MKTSIFNSFSPLYVSYLFCSSDEDELPSPGSADSVSHHSEENPYRFSDDSDSDSQKSMSMCT